MSLSGKIDDETDYAVKYTRIYIGRYLYKVNVRNKLLWEIKV